jgi:pimeloyl-ACP methyl ester carboxylesterase
MMRGFAGSGGRQVFNGCNQEQTGLANAADIDAVLAFMARQPGIDAGRTIIAGQSFGGWNTLAVGTLRDGRIAGLINFAGGAVISNCEATAETLARGAEHFAKLTKVPSIWFYGDNDSVFAPPVWHAMYAGYVAGGGVAELVAYGSFMTDSHNLLGFPEGLEIWAPKVDTFLHNLGLPADVTHPEYLPVPVPEPSDFADVDDVDAVPYLDDKGREGYRKFLSDRMPRAFVLSQDGMAASFTGGFDPLGRALTTCRKMGRQCQVYAVDDEVTWKRPTPAPPPSHFAALDDAGAIPFITDGGRDGYQKFLGMRKPKAFVIAPDGGWSASALGADPVASALAACGKAHAGCRLYAVDDDVVWHAAR